MVKDLKLLCGSGGLLVTLLWSADVLSAEFNSCREVRAYFARPSTETPYARVRSLENALKVMTTQLADAADCEDWMMERALFEYGTALEKYSHAQTDPDAKRTWALGAANAHKNYMDWFLGLTESRQNRLIQLFSETQAATPDEFKNQKRKWLRLRVGNVLAGMGSAFVIARAHEDLIAAYEKYSEESTEVFPNEVAKKWHKWLRAKPDFQRDRTNSEIAQLISDSTEVYGQWGAFKRFLEVFVALNPSIKDEWGPIRKRIVEWLSSSS